MKERRRSRGKEKLQMEKVNDYSLCSFFFFFLRYRPTTSRKNSNDHNFGRNDFFLLGVCNCLYDNCSIRYNFTLSFST